MNTSPAAFCEILANIIQKGNPIPGDLVGVNIKDVEKFTGFRKGRRLTLQKTGIFLYNKFEINKISSRNNGE